MKGIAGTLIVALVCVVLGAAALVVSRFERRMADAQQNLATLQYETAASQLADAGGYVEYANWVPGVGDRVRRELRTRQAALNYWQRQYDTIVPNEATSSSTDTGNVELQLVAANAAYRAGQATAKDHDAMKRVLDEAVGGYLAVLKSETWNEDAAYNYEYMVRVRDEFAKSRKNPPPPKDDKNSSNGQSGAPQVTSDTRKFEIYVPLESTERTKAAEAGKATPNKRKG